MKRTSEKLGRKMTFVGSLRQSHPTGFENYLSLFNQNNDRLKSVTYLQKLKDPGNNKERKILDYLFEKARQFDFIRKTTTNSLMQRLFNLICQADDLYSPSWHGSEVIMDKKEDLLVLKNLFKLDPDRFRLVMAEIFLEKTIRELFQSDHMDLSKHEIPWELHIGNSPSVELLKRICEFYCNREADYDPSIEAHPEANLNLVDLHHFIREFRLPGIRVSNSVALRTLDHHHRLSREFSSTNSRFGELLHYSGQDDIIRLHTLRFRFFNGRFTKDDVVSFQSLTPKDSEELQIHYRLTSLVLSIRQRNLDAYDRLMSNLDRFCHRNLGFIDDNLRITVTMFRKLRKNNMNAALTIRNMGTDFHLLNFRELEGAFKEYNYFDLRYSSFLWELSRIESNGLRT